jgi:hypothetical protein
MFLRLFRSDRHPAEYRRRHDLPTQAYSFRETSRLVFHFTNILILSFQNYQISLLRYQRTGQPENSSGINLILNPMKKILTLLVRQLFFAASLTCSLAVYAQQDVALRSVTRRCLMLKLVVPKEKLLSRSCSLSV